MLLDYGKSIPPTCVLVYSDTVCEPKRLLSSLLTASTSAIMLISFLFLGQSRGGQPPTRRPDKAHEAVRSDLSAVRMMRT